MKKWLGLMVVMFLLLVPVGARGDWKVEDPSIFELFLEYVFSVMKKAETDNNISYLRFGDDEKNEFYKNSLVIYPHSSKVGIRVTPLSLIDTLKGIPPEKLDKSLLKKLNITVFTFLKGDNKTDLIIDINPKGMIIYYGEKWYHKVRQELSEMVKKEDHELLKVFKEVASKLWAIGTGRTNDKIEKAKNLKELFNIVGDRFFTEVMALFASDEEDVYEIIIYSVLDNEILANEILNRLFPDSGLNRIKAVDNFLRFLNSDDLCRKIIIKVPNVFGFLQNYFSYFSVQTDPPITLRNFQCSCTVANCDCNYGNARIIISLNTPLKPFWQRYKDRTLFGKSTCSTICVAAIGKVVYASLPFLSIQQVSKIERSLSGATPFVNQVRSEARAVNVNIDTYLILKLAERRYKYKNSNKPTTEVASVVELMEELIEANLQGKLTELIRQLLSTKETKKK